MKKLARHRVAGMDDDELELLMISVMEGTVSQERRWLIDELWQRFRRAKNGPTLADEMLEDAMKWGEFKDLVKAAQS